MIPEHFPTRTVNDEIPQRILGQAERVRTAPKWGFELVPEAEKFRRDEIKRWIDRVKVASCASDVLFPTVERNLPLALLTHEKAQMLNVLRGYPVRYWSVSRDFPPEGKCGVFLRILLPGDRGNAFDCAYDIKLATSWEERDSGPACGSGTQHVLGIGALRRLDVLAMDPWDVCFQCGCWRPRRLLRRAFDYFENDEDRLLNGDTVECKQVYDRDDFYGYGCCS